MEKTSLGALAEDLLGQARAAGSGRAAHTVYGGAGHLLRQTVIALLEGQQLHEHNSPGEATLQVLRGRVRLTSAAGSVDAGAGELVPVPPQRHGLAGLQDSVVVLTVVSH